MIIRVLLVNEQPALCLGIRAILDQVDDIELVGEYYSGEAALENFAAIQSDIILLANTLPDFPGEVVADEIVRMGLPIQILVYSRISEDQQVKTMLAAGAMGYALTTDDPDTLIAAIRTVADGGVWLSPRLTEQTFTRIDRELETAEPLTERERQILGLIGQGLQNREIAETLTLEWQTVKNYSSRVYKKLGVASRPQAILRAIRLGLVEIELGRDIS